MTVLGLGHDVVDVAGFAAQLSEPGSRMRGLFSARELRQAAARGEAKHDGEAVHLAARWAGKEAVLKAWEAALQDAASPYTLDNFPWSRIEILDDRRGRPFVALAADVDRVLRSSVGCAGPETADGGATEDHGECDGAISSNDLAWHISLSHDGPIASAVVILTVA